MTTDSVESFAVKARECLSRAIEYSWSIAKEDGHWYGELKSNVTLTAEQVFFHLSLGIPLEDAQAYKRYLLSQQQDDGSWSIAPFYPGDVSVSAEAYLALKILGLSPDEPKMLKARDFIRSRGGVAKVRIFTRIYFAQFGLFPWGSVPQLPAEFILMPSSLPLNIYRLSSWTRSTLVPLMVLRHYEKIYALPNGLSANNDYLDELWLDPGLKFIPYTPSLLAPEESDWITLIFAAVDKSLHWVGGLKNLPFRSYALRRCIQWILDHQEPEGDWAGIIPPMHAGIQALVLSGFSLQDDVIQRGLAAVERFTWHDDKGKRLQSCISPVWDTVLMVRSLCDAGVNRNSKRLKLAINWIKDRQLLGPEGDWRVSKPQLAPGAFSFEYNNTWYPDVDDTSCAILALLHQDPNSVSSFTVTRAVIWLCGMQNHDGGWGGFDHNNDSLWLNKIPFSDMGALCDPSAPDCTGGILEAFGMILGISQNTNVDKDIIRRISFACDRGICYLARTQEQNGSWYGRWGVNYVFGTSHALCGLQYFRDGRKMVQSMMDTGSNWLKQVQNADGGWGEALESYRDASLAGEGPSTASQTAWGLMGVLTTSNVNDQSVIAAVGYVTRTQTDIKDEGATWPEKRYTSTGFPNFFYIGYTLYPHYFPMMALGRFVQRVEGGMGVSG